jgi:hypothetical protein
MTLAHVVHRVAIDSMFAAQLLQDPRKTLADAKLPADDETVALVTMFLREHPDWGDLCLPQPQSSEILTWRE